MSVRKSRTRVADALGCIQKRVFGAVPIAPETLFVSSRFLGSTFPLLSSRLSILAKEFAQWHTSKHEVTPSGIEGKEVFNTVKDKAKEVLAGAADIPRAAKDKANERASTAGENVKDVATAVGDLTMHARDQVQEWTATAADKTSEAVQDMGKKLTDLVRRYPIQSLLVGFTIGFLLTRATTRI
jgi:ElaB/YqjD/DUF883 family membrane-anchored ribosome-binding protein